MLLKMLVSLLCICKDVLTTASGALRKKIEASSRYFIQDFFYKVLTNSYKLSSLTQSDPSEFGVCAWLHQRSL